MASRKTNPRRRKYYETDYKTGISRWVTRPIPSDKKKGNPMPVFGYFASEQGGPAGFYLIERKAPAKLGGRSYRRSIARFGRKVKGGRAISVKNFTGTITRKNDGTVIIRGRKK